MAIFTRNTTKAAAMALAMALAPAAANAELLLSDNFDYPVGNLYEQGDWIKLASQTAEPIQVAAPSLAFAGYQEASGNAAVLNGGTSTSAQRLKKQFSEEAVTSGTLTYSALVKVTEISTLQKYAFIGFVGKNSNGFGDGVGSTSLFAVTSVAAGSADGKFKFGFASGTSTPAYADTEFDLNTTYLIVASYDFVSKDINLWINPADANAAAAVTLAGKGSISTTNGVQGICLYQGCSSNNTGNIIVDAVRVGNTVADVLGADGGGGDQGGDENNDATATASPASLNFEGIFVGDKSEAKTINVKGEKLTEAITLSSTSPAFKVSPATISAEEAMAGATVQVTFVPTAAIDYAGTINVMHGSSQLASVAVAGAGVAIETPMSYMFVSNALYEGTAGENYYKLESSQNAVTYVDAPNNRFFIQDRSGALEISTEFVPASLKIGDKVRYIYAMAMDGKLYLIQPIKAEHITAGTPIEPTTYSIKDIKFDPQSYWNKLVTLEDAEFANAGQAFAAGSTQATVDGTNFNVRPFDGCDLIGTTIPEKGSVSGILVAKNGLVIWPRSTADVTAAQVGEAELAVTSHVDFTDVAEINVPVKLATFTVEAKNLPAAAQIWFGGKNRDMFTTNIDEIPAGTGTYDVVVTYSPTAIGAHTATINFDATPTELSCTYSISGKAYDPANPPVITVPAEVEEFSAEVGQTQQKQFVISSANMVEHGSVVIESQSAPGTFIINSTALVANIDNNYTVTFKPLNAGTYTATIKVTGLKADTKYIQLTGVATGDAPIEDKEGTELRLDASNPLKLLIEDFNNVTNNKPLALAGWDNVAVQGTRAWWGYNFTNPANGAAKVTAYDSKATEDSPAEMLLVTPALDFKNAESKLFTFKVMGQLLPEGATKSSLEVLYIEDADYMESLGDLGLPCNSDQNNTWMDLVLDLEDLDLADVFFIGFRFKGDRGHNYPETYFIDDVSWGRTDLPQIKVRNAAGQNAAIAGVEMIGAIGQTDISDPLTVVGKNLTEDITLSISGANPSKFSTSTTSLPADGGSFAIHFTPEEQGLHSVCVDLKSADAPTCSIPVEALGTEASGIEGIEADSTDSQIFNLQGMRLSGRVGVKDLRSGIYIIGGKKVTVK